MSGVRNGYMKEQWCWARRTNPATQEMMTKLRQEAVVIHFSSQPRFHDTSEYFFMKSSSFNCPAQFLTHFPYRHTLA